MEFESLGERQRELIRVVYIRGGATVREIHSGIPDPPPSLCGIRTLLNRMVRKGLLRTRPSGRHSELLYLPVASNSDVSLRAFDRIAKEYFRGSKYRAADALERLASFEESEQPEMLSLRAA
jgi:predicted transcriptional regulator